MDAAFGGGAQAAGHDKLGPFREGCGDFYGDDGRRGGLDRRLWCGRVGRGFGEFSCEQRAREGEVGLQELSDFEGVLWRGGSSPVRDRLGEIRAVLRVGGLA